jgi:hypothetical protein
MIRYINSREWWCGLLAYLWKEQHILGRSQRHDPSLKRNLWRVYLRRIGSRKELRLSLGVKNASVKVLKARNFKPFYKMQRTVFEPTRGLEKEAGVLLLCDMK